MGSLAVLKAAGLQTAHNPFSGVSPGGLYFAKNVSVFSNGVIEPRRGFRQLTYTLTNDTGVSNVGAFFGDTLITSHGADDLSYDTGSAFTAYSGSYDSVDDAMLRMKFVESKQNVYFNTSVGVYVLETATGTVRAAGLPRPMLSVNLVVPP